ncbi:Uncharacterised protein [Yersinia frederiksenii]|nr:Uncharacterised protein [Yersinia frederiksenii]
MPVTLQHILEQVRLRGQVAPLSGLKDMGQFANAQPLGRVHWPLAVKLCDA